MAAKKESQILKAAKWAKKEGYKYMSSVVKSRYKTIYLHIVLIDDIIKTGKWQPAPKVQFPSGAHGRQGQIKVPEKTVARDWALYKVRS